MKQMTLNLVQVVLKTRVRNKIVTFTTIDSKSRPSCGTIISKYRSIMKLCSMYFYLAVTAILGVALVVWETRAYEAMQDNPNVFVPSVHIYSFMQWVRHWSYILGTWCARYVNPMYYLRQLWPHLRLYFQAIQRLILSVMPPVFPGYSFVQGFFSNPFYGITTIVGFIAILVWWSHKLQQSKQLDKRQNLIIGIRIFTFFLVYFSCFLIPITFPSNLKK